MVRIRRAEVKDSAALAGIQVDSYRAAYVGVLPQPYLDHFTYQEQEHDWRDLLSTRARDEIYVAETTGGEIVGYVLGRAGSSEIPPYDAEIVSLHVRRDYQRRGTGRRLIATIARRLEQQGSTALIVWVLQENPARAMYERLGGLAIGEKPWDGNEQFGVQVKEVAYGWRNLKELQVQNGHSVP